MIMRCGRQGWSPRRPNLICHNPSVTAIVSRVRVLLAHQGMSLPDALAPADVRLPVWVKPGLPPWGPHVRFRRVQTLVREGSPLVKLRNSCAYACRR